MKNPVCYFEIPVIDLERAIAFYNAVFGCQLERVEVDGDDRAMFHASPKVGRMTAALAKGKSCWRAFCAIWSAVGVGRSCRSSQMIGLPR
jgi:predicted enzyme related to lactoylglutathione lyase